MRIGEFLGEFVSAIPEGMQNGEILKISYSENFSDIAFFASFISPQGFNRILEFEKTAEQSLSAERVRLYCSYPSDAFTG